MANPFDQIQGPVRELHHQAGWSGRVFNDADSPESGDWVDRSAETDDFDAGTECTIRIEWGTAPNEVRDASGREVMGDVTIVVDPTEATFTSGDEDTDASQIVDQRNGDRYRLLRRIDENTGLHRYDAEHLS